MTLTPAASRRVWLTELAVMGMGTASAASEVVAYRVTTVGATGGGNIAGTPWDTFSPAAASSVFTTWTTQPVISTALVRLSVNANGGIYRWVARPGQELNAIGGQATNMQISIRPFVNGGGNYTVGITWIEDPI
jgi:hypothetical protein